MNILGDYSCETRLDLIYSIPHSLLKEACRTYEHLTDNLCTFHGAFYTLLIADWHVQGVVS